MRVWLSRLLDPVLRRHRDERLTDEVQSHLDHLTDRYVRDGLPVEDARLAARRAFGGIDQVKSAYRDQRGLPFVDALFQDLRFGTRILAKDRSFAAAAILALGLGIGVNTTVFTIISGMSLQALPVERGDQIMHLGSQELTGRRLRMSVSYEDFLDWRSATKSFTDVAAFANATINVGDSDRPADRLAGTFITANAFSILGEEPALGRDFSDDDDRPGATPVAILAHGTWLDRYAADAAIVGRVIRLNGMPTTVIGVMPAGFRFPLLADLWQPMGQRPDLAAEKRNQRTLGAFGRLRDDATLEQARAELTAIASALEAQHPGTNQGVGVTVTPFTEYYVGPPTEAAPLIMMAAACLVLLISCVNVASLLLARSAHRAREIALRAALGAARSRIVRQLLVESLLLAAISGGMGLLLAVGGMRLFNAEVMDMNLPYWIHFGFDGRVFTYLAVVCLGTALMCGLAPAWQLSRTDTHNVLKEGGRGVAGSLSAGRWSRALLVGELALTIVLLTGAGLLIRSAAVLNDADRILNARHLLTARLSLPPARFRTGTSVERSTNDFRSASTPYQRLHEPRSGALSRSSTVRSVD